MMATGITVHAAADLPGSGGSRRPDPALKKLLRMAVQAVLESEGISQADLSVVLLSDVGIADLNQRFLQHREPTDVLAFPLTGEGEGLAGEVYIGYEQAARQAAEWKVPLREELARLAIHGALHVLGYDHPAGDERVESEMWERQERILSGLLGS